MVATHVPEATGGEFAGFVRREEERLLRAAFLVCGDVVRAEGLVEEALVDIGRRWPQVAEEEPAAEVRRLVYRAALADAERAGTGGERDVPLSAPEGWATSRREPEDLARRADLAAALGRLTPRQRAVLALLVLDGATERDAARDLRARRAAVRADAQSAVARLQEALPDLHLGGGRVDGPAVRWVLETATEDLDPPDLAERAARRAEQSRRDVRRRGVLVTGGIVAAAALGYAVLERVTGAPAPAPGPAAGDSLLATTDLAGVTVLHAPDADQEGVLPVHEDRRALGIPDPLGATDPREVRPLPGDGMRGPVLAVYLVQGDRATFDPLVQSYAEAGPGTALWGAPVAPDARQDTLFAICGPRTVSSDRRRVVLAGTGAVSVLDVRSAEVIEVPMPDPTLRTVGWAGDDRTVVALGRDHAWVVDPRAGSATRAEGPVYHGWQELAWTDGSTVRRSFAPDGTLSGSIEVAGPPTVPIGQSASTPDGWVASPAYLPGAFQERLGRGQGVLVVSPDPDEPPRVLAARVTSGLAVRYRVLRWPDDRSVLVESFSTSGGSEQPVHRVLLWDVPAGRLWRVAQVQGVGPAGSWFTGQWAL